MMESWWIWTSHAVRSAFAVRQWFGQVTHEELPTEAKLKSGHGLQTVAFVAPMTSLAVPASGQCVACASWDFEASALSV